MSKVKITVVESKCRSGYHKKGDCFIIEDLCPPLCRELWNSAYPSVYALQNGAMSYDEETPIGFCDWYEKDQIVKLEEVTILNEYQGKAFGSYMLKKLLYKAGI